MVRADFDVAMQGGKILDDFRIKETLPTLRFIAKKGGAIRLMAHLDRPAGHIYAKLSLRQILKNLEKVLDKKVVFIKNPLEEKIFEKYNQSPEVILFENIRFWPEEEKNDFAFAKRLARWGDIYVNENFATSHRPHASFTAITRFLPSFAGLHLEKEIFYLEKILQDPPRPLVAILGGVKLETKIPLLANLLQLADKILLGGALANSMLLAQSFRLGKSLVDEKMVEYLRGLKIGRDKLSLPMDFRVAKNVHSRSRIVAIENLAKDEIIFDIGPATVKAFVDFLAGAKTVIFSGPLGLAEINKFSEGTKGIAEKLIKLKVLKIAGGGDTIAVLHKYNLLRAFSHVSTGGGAMLEFLSGKKLPGLEGLKK